ncbi:MAG: histidine triad nucleotide-binding protein [Anaerolineae bacterium]|nr:histidine triad nucleotide-binding protein [Anaerolineae bacterium]
MSQECIFCKIVAGEIPASKVYDDDHVLAFNDINPQAPTHVLVIPKRHIESLATVEPEDGQLLGHLLTTASRLARETGLAERGYRVVLNIGQDGGMAVYHLHAHILGGRRMDWPPG